MKKLIIFKKLQKLLHLSCYFKLLIVSLVGGGTASP